jgi:hypothetical protein
MTTNTTAPADNDDDDINQADLLMHVVVMLLAPMFVTASGGDIGFARMAAFETLKAYQNRYQTDLIAVAQIIAYGLAALGSLSLSMEDGISLSMALRLRGNANALTRSAELNRRTLRETSAASQEPAWAPDSPEAQYEATVLASLAETQKVLAEAQSPRNPAPPPAAPAPAAPAPTPAAPAPIATRSPTQHQNDVIWAAGMTEVAAEFTANLAHLPPKERKHASMRAAALSSAANALLLGTAEPQLPPGGLAAMMRANPGRPPNQA